MLAYASPQALEDLLNRITFTQHTARSHKNKESLLADLVEIRKRGYALDDVEYHDHVRAIYAPTFNAQGLVIGVIGITAVLSRLPKSRIPKVAKQVIAAANKLSTQLGYT
jgi:IclR family acetate operon transcriptional repressor